MNNKQETWAHEVLARADIKINGARPQDIMVHNPASYARVLAQGSLGLGESYMEGWWDCPALDVFFTNIFTADLQNNIGFSFSLLIELAKAKIFNLQSISRAFQVAQKHYDLGNDFFAAMIGKSMMYSCAYWKDAQDLASAQYAKLDLICKKLHLQPGQRILEIGCGWGAFAKYAAEHYKVSVVGVTVSKEQLAFAKEHCKGLPVDLRLQDYRQLNEKFDHVVSIAMFEAVGAKNFRDYMQVARRCLKDNGLFLLHTMGSKNAQSDYDSWVDKYIFPNGIIPSMKQVLSSIEQLFIVEDVHNIGADYDRTLMEWHKNFEASWPQFKDKYGQTFYRMWRYYLLFFAALFRSRQVQLWHIVFSPHGVLGGYKSVR